ncbi:MAG: IclR family transcriptional regulator [Verrucomicrobia bacterium]|nr:IclR family transcriptional regulator [Verrucomicrobiota bacterium]
MIQSVEKALRLLQALDLQTDWIGVRELSRQLKFSPPTTHNLLKTLVAASFVEANPATRQYRLGLAAIRLGAGSDPLNNMRLFARPVIEKLAAEFDETIVVVTWQDGQAVVVDWIQAEHPLAVTHNHGVIEHPIVFASGRVLLAHQSRDEQLRYAKSESLGRLGANVPRTRAELLELLAKVAADGYALTENVGDSGVIALGAPVFDAKGRLLLAIGCSAPISRTTHAQLLQVRTRLLELTASMTKRLRGSNAALGTVAGS